MALMTSFLSLLQPFAEPSLVRREESATSTVTTMADATAAIEVLLAEAEEAREQALRDADETREDAQIQAEALREAAWQEGFHSGEEVARVQVEAELKAQWEIQRDTVRAEVQGVVDSIGRARETLWEAQEAEMVGLALDVARQIIKTEVTQNPEIVTHILHNALRRITDKEQVRIRVSVADAGLVRAQRDDLVSLLDGLKNLEIVDDRRVSPGGCVIETNAGTIDAKIETQLAEVERALGVSEDE